MRMWREHLRSIQNGPQSDLELKSWPCEIVTVLLVCVVSHHGADHPAEVDGVCPLSVVSAAVSQVLRADLKELQTGLQDPRLILHILKDVVINFHRRS